MDYKSNLNRLHYLLTEKFQQVEVSEMSNQKLGNYIELTIKENLECKIFIRKKDLDNSNINFLYLTNPLQENSQAIERVSSIENFANCVEDIISNKRFDSDYVNSVK